MCYCCQDLFNLWTFLKFNVCDNFYKKNPKLWPGARTYIIVQRLLARHFSRRAGRARRTAGHRTRRGSAHAPDARRLWADRSPYSPSGSLHVCRWLGRDETCATRRAAGRSAGCWASTPAPWRRTNGASPHYLHCAGPPLARLSATARAGIFVGPIAAAATRIDVRNCAAFIHIAPTQDGGHIF